MKLRQAIAYLPKKTVVLSLLACILISFAVPIIASAANYKATIALGTSDSATDCHAFYNWLANTQNGDSYTTRERKGWSVVNGSPVGNATRASATDLKNAKSNHVLYWSSHGSSGNSGPSLHTTNNIAVASTLGVNGNNWNTNCEWRNSTIRVAMFAACKTLDNTYGQVKYMARVLKASNLRVITGYHEAAPQSPYDKNIIDAFFGQGNHVGVIDSESIRSSWKLSNEWHDAYTPWAVLCYQSNYNQFYRMPGFPGLTYSDPAPDATVYRYWSQYLNGQTINPRSLIEWEETNDSVSLPPEIHTTDVHLVVDLEKARSIIGSSATQIAIPSSLVVNRDIVETDVSLDAEVQRQVADDFIVETVGRNSLTDAILTETVEIREEIDPDDGLVSGTETVVGRTYCYSNQYRSIRIVGNFIKVGTDAGGIEYFIDRWQEVKIPTILSEDNSENAIDRISYEQALLAIGATLDDVKSVELVYAPITDGVYRLCYEIVLNDAPTCHVDCQTGRILER